MRNLHINQLNKEKKQILFFIILIIFVLGTYIYLIVPSKAHTNIVYCEELAEEINWIGNAQLRCVEISEQEDEVIFYCEFNEKLGLNKYSADKYTVDMIKMKNAIVKYMIEHPQNELNSKKIKCIFNTLPGDSQCIYNYNYLTKEKVSDSKNFAYFEFVDTKHISSIEGLGNACSMIVYAEEIDTLDFFKEWTNLKYLRLICLNITEEQVSYLKELLPDCEIVIQ